MHQRFIMTLAATFAGLVCHAAFAADDPNVALIEARQGEMQLRAYSVAPLFGMAKGKVPYDAEQAAKLANNLKVLMNIDMGPAWKEGTGNDNYAKVSHALPEVWSTYPKVAEAGKEYAATVDELAAMAGNGLEALRAAIGDVGDACKGCHDDFREEE